MKPPCRLSSAAVIGNLVSVRSTVNAQIRSLKIHVMASAARAASAGRHSGSTIVA